MLKNERFVLFSPVIDPNAHFRTIYFPDTRPTSALAAPGRGKPARQGAPGQEPSSLHCFGLYGVSGPLSFA